jgi:orotate phosphoribosyltransferase
MRSFSSSSAFSAAMSQALRDLLAQKALRVAAPGESFTLSTGRRSNFYFNCKPVTMSSEGASLVADAFLEKVNELPEPITAVGGRTFGADPIVFAMMMRARERGQVLEGFLVREKQKKHGTKELIANGPAPGAKVVIVDDVVTTGASIIEAIHAARDAGCNIIGVIALMDRQEDNGAASIKAEVPNYVAIYTRQDFPEIGEAEKWDTTKSEQPSTIREGSTYSSSGR